MDLTGLNGIEVFRFGETNTSTTTPTLKSTDMPELMKQIGEPSDDAKQIYHCAVCDVDLNSKIVYEQHKKGFKHIKRENFFKLQANQIPTQNEMEVISNRGFKCDVCNLVLLSKPIYDQHVSGQKHLKRLKSIESSEKAGTSLKCEVCNIDVMNQEQMEVHLSGKKHAKKLKIIEKINDVANSISKSKNKAKKSENQAGKSETADAPAENEQFKCEQCNLSVMSKDQLTIHLAGKKHAKKVQEINDPNKSTADANKKTTDDQFENLKIAWDKYMIKEEFKEKLKVKYDFYCELCNKYMQKKLQLVDHLKSKKHHRKIYEKRNQTNTNTTTKRITFVKKNASIKPSNAKRPGIKFVSSNATNTSYSNTLQNNMTSTTYRMYNSNVNNMDLNAAFEQPVSNNVYSAAKPGYVQYYQPTTSSQPPPLMANFNQENCSYPKRKSDTAMGSTMSTYSYSKKYLKNNESLPISTAYNNSTYGSYNQVSNVNTNYTNNYENISPVQSNSLEQQQQQQNQSFENSQTNDTYRGQKTETTPSFYDMFTNMAYLQYSAAYAVAKQNIK